MFSRALLLFDTVTKTLYNLRSAKDIQAVSKLLSSRLSKMDGVCTLGRMNDRM